jgi:short-subunit dehydrogenase
MATALVTGGTSGIGAEFARTLAARGFDLVLVARDRARLDSTATALHAASGINVQVIVADLADRDDLQRVADRLSDAGAPIDFFVNNAGFGVHSSLLSVDSSKHEYALDVMVRAVLVLGGAAARGMKARGAGSILNVASIAGLLTMGSYSAIKAWVLAYSQGLSVELRGTGVTSTALMPGWVRTEFHTRAGIRTGSIPSFLWIDAGPLVRTALRDVERRRVVSIPSVRYRLIACLVGYAPRRVVRTISRVISSSRNDDEVQAPSPSDPNHPAETTGQGI